MRQNKKYPVRAYLTSSRFKRAGQFDQALDSSLNQTMLELSYQEETTKTRVPPQSSTSKDQERRPLAKLHFIPRVVYIRAPEIGSSFENVKSFFTFYPFVRQFQHVKQAFETKISAADETPVFNAYC